MSELFQMYILFFRMGAVTFGGGYAMLPILRREIIQSRQWMDEETIMDYYALSQGLPGIIAVNVAVFIGYYRKKIPGALAAALGVGQEQLHRQAGGLGNLLAGIAGGADGVLGENAAVGNAELDHELLFVVVAHQSDVHMTPSFLGGIGRACFPLRF